MGNVADTHIDSPTCRCIDCLYERHFEEMQESACGGQPPEPEAPVTLPLLDSFESWEEMCTRQASNREVALCATVDLTPEDIDFLAGDPPYVR